MRTIQRGDVIFSKFKTGNKIGEGSYGVVFSGKLFIFMQKWIGIDMKNGKKVAIKGVKLSLYLYYRRSIILQSIMLLMRQRHMKYYKTALEFQSCIGKALDADAIL